MNNVIVIYEYNCTGYTANIMTYALFHIFDLCLFSILKINIMYNIFFINLYELYN